MWLLGLAKADASATDDASLELKSFLARARRASAEIRSASPTDFSFETKAGSEMRIWELAVRVSPADEPAFDATVEVAWARTRDIEERLERGESLSGIPAGTQVLEVAFERGNRDQVLALQGEDGGPMHAFRRMIVGRSLSQDS